MAWLEEVERWLTENKKASVRRDDGVLVMAFVVNEDDDPVHVKLRIVEEEDGFVLHLTVVELWAHDTPYENLLLKALMALNGAFQFGRWGCAYGVLTYDIPHYGTKDLNTFLYLFHLLEGQARMSLGGLAHIAKTGEFPEDFVRHEALCYCE